MILREKFAASRLCIRAPFFLTVAAVISTAFVSASAQVPTDLTSAQFAPNCGAANAIQIFPDGFLGSGAAGVNNMEDVSDPDIVLIGNQWWLIFASTVNNSRLQPVAAYLPPGASLSTTGIFPTDPNGWHLVGANTTDTGQGVAISPNPSPAGWDTIAAETPSIDVEPDGTVNVYYAGHNLGNTNFEIGRMQNVVNGVATQGTDPVPAMIAEYPWEFDNGLGAILEQSVRWIPELNKYIMYNSVRGYWDTPPRNDIEYSESTDGITWTNRQELNFPYSYWDQDFLFNPSRNRFEMVLANDPTGQGGGHGRNLVWRESAGPGTQFSDWQNEVTLLNWTDPGTPGWRDEGLLAPAIKYGNLPGEENRLYVFFHSYGSADAMSIGRFYCDAIDPNPGYTVQAALTYMNVSPGSGGTMPITVNPINGFSGAVNFTITGAPAGSTTAYIPGTATTGTAFVAIPPSAPAGRYPITVTGTSGNLTREATFTLNVSGQSQTITIQPLTPDNIAYAPGEVYTVNATASSGLPVTLRVGGNGTLNGNVLTVTGGGDVIIAADQAGNATYSPAPEATTTLHVQPGVQFVTVQPVPAQMVGATVDFNPLVSSSSGLQGFGYYNQTPTICSVNGTVFTFLSPGVCYVIVIQWGDSNYPPAGAPIFVTVNPYNLNLTAGNVALVAGATPPITVLQLIANYSSPGLTQTQLGALIANAEVGVTVAGQGLSYNVPIYSYGTYNGDNLLPAVPANQPLGAYTLTPYITGPDAANVTFTETPGTLTIDPPGTQSIDITAANLTVTAGTTPTQTLIQLVASRAAPGLTDMQFMAALSNNTELGFTVTGPNFSYNLPLFSYGTYNGDNLLPVVPPTAPVGTYTLTPYLTGPGASAFAFTGTPGTITIAPTQ